MALGTANAGNRATFGRYFAGRIGGRSGCSARPKARDAWPDRYAGRSQDCPFNIGLFVPMSGPLGIYGPSSISCAQLAASEINRSGGLLGREVRLEIVNAVDEVESLAEYTSDLLQSGRFDAIVGMHTSSVRRLLAPVVCGRVPYVYTTMFEGGEHTPGVYAIGETPWQQLRPAIRALASRRSAKRWAFVGNDYVWPRACHALARTYVKDAGGELKDDFYLPLGVSQSPEAHFVDQALDRLARLNVDAVLVSLVGQDAVVFHREFGSAGPRLRGMARLSCAIEENGLLAIGGDFTDELYVASGYFASLQTEANMAFREHYYNFCGQRAPTLNGIGQANYEGVHFLATLIERQEGSQDCGPIKHRSARGMVYVDNDNKHSPMYLARANGHFFEVIQRL